MTELKDDPSNLLQAVFERIAVERMAGLPILNPALAVATVGFRPWREYWLGVLVTPWFMNMVARPVEPDATPDLTVRGLELPSGLYEFTVTREDGIGVYLSCPLISPMSQFASQADALAVAEAVLEEVFQAPAEVAKGGPDLSRRGFFRALLPATKTP
ncbi:MAG: [NiFe]-hydrogenase assembly chaperone HybE [Gallionellaceae bacterium]|nr:[NiFe]-hydrogenase assembly chaperone HybE [Gallionellaceae bacterium]